MHPRWMHECMTLKLTYYNKGRYLQIINSLKWNKEILLTAATLHFIPAVEIKVNFIYIRILDVKIITEFVFVCFFSHFLVLFSKLMYPAPRCWLRMQLWIRKLHIIFFRLPEICHVSCITCFWSPLDACFTNKEWSYMIKGLIGIAQGPVF